MASRSEQALSDLLTDSLSYEACLDVAVYALLVARELGRGRALSDAGIVTAWSSAARELVGSVAEPFDRAFLKRRLRELI